MELKTLSDRIFYYPHQAEMDRPTLLYIKGEKFSLAIDAGYSDAHVEEFYNALETSELKKTDFTVITHWHWDHTFGLHNIHGVSVAHQKTNEFLEEERTKLFGSEYVSFLKQDDKCFAKEYKNDKEIIVVLSDIEFSKEISINLGGLSAKVFHTISPHTEDTTLIYIPEEKVLFLGDATSGDFSNNEYMDKDKLKHLINLIENTDCEYCILSHTDPLTKTDLLSYLTSIL